MAQKKLTINLPRSPEILEELLAFLLSHNLITEKEVYLITEETDKTSKKSRWELAAERLDSEGFLDGQGEKVKELFHDFRESFNL